VLKAGDRYIYYLVTKDRTGAGCYPTYEDLQSSLEAMKTHMVKNDVVEVAMPQIGCGLDKLKWDQVETRIRNVFGDTDVEVTIYKYVPPSK
jgi:O-acetyl-ADP-ribose deacetylase (regulator of RNase III)